MDRKLRQDYTHCRRVMKKHSKTFSMAFSRLPSPKREAVWAFYAFNRNLDDIGDKSGDKAALQTEEQRFNDLWQGTVYPNPVYRALADVIQTYPIDREAVSAMFCGQYRDLDHRTIKTEEDLLEYCYEVAGSVGHMLLPILATQHHKDLKESSRKIGIAMQLTNILRDVREDFENGRIYLPADKLESQAIDLRDVIQNGPSNDYISLWEHYAAMAVKLYNEGLEDLRLYDDDSRFILASAAYLYAGIIAPSRQANYSTDGRGHLGFAKKMQMLYRLKGQMKTGNILITGKAD